MRCFVPHLHTVSSCVRSGLCRHNTASFRFAPSRKVGTTLLYIPAVLCLPPLVFQRLLFRTAIGVCSAIALHLDKERLRLTFIFSPPFHAHSHYISLRSFAQFPCLWWLFDCRNTATSLLEKTIISAIATIIYFSAVLGGV